MVSDDAMKEELAGTTAVIVLMKDSTIYCVSSRKMPVIKPHFLMHSTTLRNISLLKCISWAVFPFTQKRKCNPPTFIRSCSERFFAFEDNAWGNRMFYNFWRQRNLFAEYSNAEFV